MVSEFTWPITLTMIVSRTGTASHGRMPAARLTHAPSDQLVDGTPEYSTAPIGTMYTSATAATDQNIVRGYVFCGSFTSWATVDALSQPMKFHIAMTRPAYQLGWTRVVERSWCRARTVIRPKGTSSKIPRAMEPFPTAFAPSMFHATQPKITTAG